MPILKRIYHNRFFPVLICLLYLLIFGIIVYFIDYRDKWQILNFLKAYVPWNLRINFLLILVGLLICGNEIIGALKSLVNRKGAILAVMVLLGFLVTCFAAPRTHRIYFDEDIYANVGQTIALSHQSGYCDYGVFEYDEYFPYWITYNKEPSGWPFLISLAFQLMGTDEIYTFFVNNILFCGSLLLAFFVARHLTGSFFAAFASSLALALIPHHLTWSNTGAVEPSAVFFGAAAVLCSVVFIKTGQARHLFLLALILPFACQMRPESGMIGFWVVLSLLFLRPRDFKDRRIWLAGLLPALFLMPHALHFYAVGGHDWGAEGAKFAFSFFRDNLQANGLYYLDNRKFPVILSLLALAGFFSSRFTWRWKLLIFLWFVLFWGIFLFFYAGSYEYGADVRYALVSFMPLAIMAGIGAERLRGLMARETEAKYDQAGQDTPDGSESAGKGRLNPPDQVVHNKRAFASGLIVLLMLFNFLQFMPLVRQVGQMAWGSRYGHNYAKEFSRAIPDRSIVLTQIPTMWFLWQKNAIQTYAGINNIPLIQDLMKRFHGHVYFHHNYWCNTTSRRNIALCQQIREIYHLEEVVVATEQDYTYGLYRMKFRD